MTETYLPPDEAKAMLVNILADFADEPDQMVNYLDHVGFDVSALGTHKDLPAAWVAHYRIGQGTYDTDRAFLDYVTWGPMASEIVRLQAEQRKGSPNDL